MPVSLVGSMTLPRLLHLSSVPCSSCRAVLIEVAQWWSSGAFLDSVPIAQARLRSYGPRFLHVADSRSRSEVVRIGRVVTSALHNGTHAAGMHVIARSGIKYMCACVSAWGDGPQSKSHPSLLRLVFPNHMPPNSTPLIGVRAITAVDFLRCLRGVVQGLFLIESLCLLFS